jgi:hypothetical protein
VPNLDDLLDANDPKQHLQRLGEVFDAFEDQDSGCMSYGVEIGGDRWFVKTAYTAHTVPMLRRAADFHLHVQHDAIVAPAAYAERPNRAVILYPWVDGKVLYHPTRSRYLSREDPLSPMYAFRRMPVEKIHRALDTVFDAHLAVAESGFVAIDFYDGSMLYDPESESMRLVDLDEYRAGQFVVGPELLSGSARYFSPEETTEGATVDERTTVFTMARTARLLLDGGDHEQDWRGNDEQLVVIAKATDPNPSARHETLADFVSAWRKATPQDADI